MLKNTALTSSYLGTPGKAREELHTTNFVEFLNPHRTSHITIHVQITSEVEEEIEGNVR